MMALFALPGCETLEFPDDDTSTDTESTDTASTNTTSTTTHKDDSNSEDADTEDSDAEDSDAYTGCIPGQDECGTGNECIAEVSLGEELEGFECSSAGTAGVGEGSSTRCTEGSVTHSYSAACASKYSDNNYNCCTPLCDLRAPDCTMEIDDGWRTIEGECIEADDGLHPDVAHFGICQFAKWAGCDPLDEDACHEGAGCQRRTISDWGEAFICVKSYEIQQPVGELCYSEKGTSEGKNCKAGLSCIENVCTFACSVAEGTCEGEGRTGTCKRHFPKADTPEGMDDLGFCELDPLPEELGLAEQ